MQVEDIRAKIKEIVSSVANVPVAEIGDQDSYQDDLGLDSLSLLEIGVDVDYEFRLGLPEEAWQDVGSIDDAVRLVADSLGRKAA